MNNKQSTIFDMIAKDYRSIHDKNLQLTGETSEYYAEYKIKEIKPILTEPLRILDIGCGDGLTSVYFKKYFKNVKYYGIDISIESINVARLRNIKSCNFQVYDGQSIPFKNKTIDCVFMSCVLHHINHKKHDDILNECYRVLIQGGKLIIFEHNPLNPITRRIVKDCVFDHDAVLLGFRKLKETIIRAGFIQLEVNFTLFLPRTNFMKKLLFIEKWFKKLPLGGQYYIVAQKP